ncbi:hypothetical protein CS022_20675 [Veronia nyctiphanis]|uniref:Uncharacterized protein n=1 Tax=Veronia nyctiphanis TaxID=1278244 RepID=A0A4Q0YRB3_9GAMM|nr:hypothetical protein [Veronia nyctiphanis]RXJ71511.1 hypothetical protein CS022_20675 [Veronia nyctiphanis]
MKLKSLLTLSTTVLLSFGASADGYTFVDVPDNYSESFFYKAPNGDLGVVDVAHFSGYIPQSATVNVVNYISKKRYLPNINWRTSRLLGNNYQIVTGQIYYCMNVNLPAELNETRHTWPTPEYDESNLISYNTMIIDVAGFVYSSTVVAANTQLCSAY